MAAERRGAGGELRRSYRPAGERWPRCHGLGAGHARGADRIIRMSWTLADLAGLAQPRRDQIGAALGMWLGAGM